jgi:ABC-type multidrug transport system permease subunit
MRGTLNLLRVSLVLAISSLLLLIIISVALMGFYAIVYFMFFGFYIGLTFSGIVLLNQGINMSKIGMGKYPPMPRYPPVGGGTRPP